MIDTKKIRIFKAFTLAEVMITMIIVALVTVFSVPVIKKSRTVMDRGVDKHSWGAFYVDDKLVVCEDGTCKSGDDDGDGEVDFTPPDGVNKFNVTVVGGGGGGAAGLSSPENTKKFFADTTATQFMYRVPNDGVYNIVAIGGGGGGGGGSLFCSGRDGQSGGAVVLSANLKEGSEYAVIVGQGGYQGASKTWGDFILQITPMVVAIAAMIVAAVYLGPLIAPAITKTFGVLGLSSSTLAGGSLATAGAAGVGTTLTEVVVYGFPTKIIEIFGLVISEKAAAGAAGKLIGIPVGALVEAATSFLTPSGDHRIGGGHGMSTSIYGGPNAGEEIDLDIVARGGTGGVFRIEKFPWGCKNKKLKGNKQWEINRFEFDPSYVAAGKDVVISKHVVSQNDNRFMCRDEKGAWTGSNAHIDICKNHLDKAIEGGYNSAITYGNAGYGGGHERKGGAGSGGYAQITEVTAYGGGAGQAGSVSVYTFERSPLNKGEKVVKVKVGKGGDGGKVNGASARFQNGQDGGFSRFGTKIIAQGGEGGKTRAVGGVSKDNNHYKGIGEDGLSVSLPSALFKNAKIDGKFNRDVFKAIEDKAGEGKNTSGLNGTPGIGGAGGSAYSILNTYSHAAYDGGSGANGLVLVTW